MPLADLTLHEQLLHYWTTLQAFLNGSFDLAGPSQATGAELGV